MIYRFEPIGIVHSCFKEKFGIPRQAGLIPEAQGRLEILPPYDRREAFQALQDYSHVWLMFVFHRNERGAWRPSVRPPRLGGNKRVGVFASRSPYRPNPLGLSTAELRAIEVTANGVSLLLGGIDLLDRTPVLDIKPYLPYADALPDAQGGYAPASPRSAVELHYSTAAHTLMQGLDPAFGAHLRRLIRQILENDPRPAYLHGNQDRRDFGMRLYDYNIRWRVDPERLLITSITPIDPI